MNENLKGTSKELQEITIVSLLDDSYILSKCMDFIEDNYFDNKEYRLIYKALKKYYNKYLSVPIKNELLVLIDDLYDEKYGDDLNKIKETALSLYDSEKPNEDFMYEQVTEFIRRNRIERSLGDIVTSIKSGDVNLDQIANDLKNSLTVRLSRSKVYNLSDIAQIPDVRKEAFGSVDSPILIKFCIEPFNYCMQYKALIPGTLNMIVGAPGRGKTTLAINQGVCAARQGYTSLHVFLGDMSKFDGLVRYASCQTGVSTNRLVELSDEELGAFIKKNNISGVFGNIYILSYAADEMTPNSLIEEISQIQKESRVHFDQIIIDYDENLATEINSMYESGGTVYNRMALFSVLNKSVIFILCQPKPEYWDKEIIPMSAAAESSKKQKIIDMMICFGSKSKQSVVGTLNLAKNRRGIDGKLVRVKKDGSKALITSITEEEYNNILMDEKSGISDDGKSIADKIDDKKKK